MATTSESEAKLARDAQFERFDDKHPVGGAIVKSVYFAGAAINAGLIKPTDEVLELAQKLMESSRPLETAKKIVSAAGTYIDQVIQPGDQRVANRDPIGNKAEMVAEQYAKFKTTPTLDQYAQLGAVAGAGVGSIIDPTHGGAKTAKVLTALDEVSDVSHVVYTTEMVNEALAAAAAAKAAKEQIQHAYLETLKRDNVFKEALDRADNTHMDMSHGVTIAQRKHFEDWNRDQAGARAEFYNKLLQERPDIALAMQKQDPSMQGIKQLITSTENDHLIGIQQYAGYKEAGVMRGHSDLERQAKEWGLEWKKSNGIADELRGGELALNKPFFEAKKAVEAAEKLDRELHADATLRLLDPNRPIDRKLEEKVARLLDVRLEGHTLSTEARQALPPELRNLPANEIVKLQQQMVHLVPENLRLSAGHQQSALPSATTPNPASNLTVSNASAQNLSASAPQSEQMQQLKDGFLHSLATATQKPDHAPIATVVPLSPTEVAAKASYDGMINHPDAGKLNKVGHVVAETFASDMGVGYNTGPLKLKTLEKEASGSDYDFLKTAVNNSAGVAAKTLTVAGGAVAVSTLGLSGVAVGAGYVGIKLAQNVIKHYDLGDKITDMAHPVLGPLKETALTLNDKIKMASDQVKTMVVPEVMNQAELQAAAQNYLKLMSELPKTPDGKHFTAQSQAVLDNVNKTIDAPVTVVHDAGPDHTM